MDWTRVRSRVEASAEEKETEKEVSWVVHKFGGTSVAGAERYRNVGELMRREPGARKAVVVSAMSGVTDALLALVDLATRRDPAYEAKLAELLARHVETARALVPSAEAERLAGVFASDGRDVADVLRGVWLGKSSSELTRELVAGYGEIWSAQMLAAHLGTAWLDARTVLTVAPGELGPVVDFEGSTARMRAWVASHAECNLLIVTGYIASTPEGVPTTLKRNGSDFSASIFGALLDASTITIWTDVDGVLSADPRRVPEAVVVDAMSYDEAIELAYFGAKVLHPRTMEPAVARGIPIWIRNTFNASHPGTRIDPKGARSSRSPVKGFSTFDGIALVNLEGTGMIGVPGVAQRLFGALRDVGVSVVLISQASSEHSICFAVPEAQAELAKKTTERAFDPEIRAGHVQRVDLLGACSVLAAVGDEMANAPGVAATFFAALGKAGVNVLAIAQGSSERNISAVVTRAQSTRALRAVHAGFYLSNRVLSVGVVGPGLVGRALLAQLAAQAPVLREESGIDLRVRAIANRKSMLLSETAIDLKSWSLDGGKRSDLDAFADHVQAEHLPHAVIVDCSANDDVAARYETWLRRGIHVVTPNKRAGAGPLARYRAIRALGRTLSRHFLYEATVGAGLPVITTLRDLIQTGDRVERIEGVLSGTLSYVFNAFETGRAFSEVVREAKSLGYTEPDPRDDLSGMDVARKLVILAREMGVEIELAAVEVEGLVPRESEHAKTPDEFLDELAAADAAMARRRDEAAARGEVLRYVGVVDSSGKATVSLRGYPRTHAFARITATDNVIAFTSSRYRAQPLIVQGPGAGPDVTAGGVFADLLRLAAYLGQASLQ
ncbi:MAG TPA: bifunctional aspartate kinase/homoserine dehydrogenase I [Polyangiaceae bacterium]|jgi:aspartokinase/homoserine dehydrogenase 1